MPKKDIDWVVVLLRVGWTDSSLRRLELRSGITRATGWTVVCLTTEEFGIREPSVLLVFTLAVLIESIGLFWGEKYYKAIKDGSLIRTILIYTEMAVSIILLSLFLLTFSDAVSIAIGGRQFFSVVEPMFYLPLPLSLYLLLYLAPIYCALCWAIRAYISEVIVMQRSIKV